MSFDEEKEIDLDELEQESDIDVCPSCGALLAGDIEATEGCLDSMGCGLFKEFLTSDEDELDDEDDFEDDLLEELDFDE